VNENFEIDTKGCHFRDSTEICYAPDTISDQPINSCLALLYVGHIEHWETVRLLWRRPLDYGTLQQLISRMQERSILLKLFLKLTYLS